MRNAIAIVTSDGAANVGDLFLIVLLIGTLEGKERPRELGRRYVVDLRLAHHERILAGFTING